MSKQFVGEKNGLMPVGRIRGPVPWSKPVETTQSVSRLGRTLGASESGFQNESKPEGVAQTPVDTAVNQ
jgi:hypothetical protein